MALPPLDAEALQRHTTALRGLARALTRGEPEAEDVVQEAWLAGLEAESPRPRNLGAWLREVVRRVAGKTARREGRRRRHEGRAVRARASDVASADVAVERLDAQRAVLDAVRRLAEPYRYAVLLRYVEGLSPADIATRQGVSLATAKSWLRRGLERLRADLDTRCGGDREAWRAAVGGVAVPAAISLWAPVLGGAMVKKAALTLVALLLVGAAVYRFVVDAGDRSGAAVPGPTEVRRTAPPPTLHGETPHAASAAGTAELAPSPSSAATRVGDHVMHRLVGRVVVAEGIDVVAAEVTARAIEAFEASSPTDPVPTVVGTPAADGGYALDVSSFFAAGARPEEIDVRADHPACVPASTRVLVAREPPSGEAQRPETFEADLALRPAGILSGRVVDPDGVAVEGAVLALLPRPLEGRGAAARADEARSGTDGRFRLRVGAEGGYVLLAARPGLRPRALDVALSPGAAVDVRDVALEPGFALEGRVLVDGAPAAGAVLRVWRRWVEGEDRGPSLLSLGAQTVGFVGGDLGVDRTQTTADAAGRFRATGLARATYVLEPQGIDSLRVHMALAERLRLPVDVPGPVVTLDVRGTRLEIRVLHAGLPVPRARVEVQAGGVCGLSGDDAGRTWLRVAPGVEYEVAAAADGYERAAVRVAVPGDAEGRTIPVELVLDRTHERPSLVVELRTPAGEEVSRAGFALVPREPDGASSVAQASLDGEKNVFRWRDLPAGSFRLRVRGGGDWHGGQGHWLEASTDVDVPAEGEARARVDLRLGGRLHVAARARDGTYLPAGVVLRDERGERVGVAFVERVPGGLRSGPGLGQLGPALSDPPLPPGRYALELSAEGYASKVVEVVTEAGKTAVLDVQLERR